ncbi:hypothetical protein DE146DRAFT_681050 [Phaeosphaeria sp. MPI-PUGE-AT-0046c]|nr:hypothetical protein DE146DRAFT_681050 [Phaeosphaeria sp. MPI-PUGE-AT-0046c]
MNNPQDPVESQKYAFAAQIMIYPALAMSKISICCAYLRIFYTDVRGRHMIQGLIVLLILTIIPFDIEAALQCKPIHVYWTEGRPASKCLQDLPGLFVNGTLNILADVFLMAIVLPRVIELKLHKRQRWALVGVVLLGTLAVVAGIVRMVRVSLMLEKPDFDPSWDSYDISIWTNTEIYVSLICAAAPGIKPVIVRLLPKALGTSLRSRTRTTGGGIELGGSSKWKHTTTIGSGRLQRQTSQTALATADGPYTECGRAGDDESWENKSGRASRQGSEDEGGIYKTSEISVQVVQHK